MTWRSSILSRKAPALPPHALVPRGRFRTMAAGGQMEKDMCTKSREERPCLLSKPESQQ